jgi:predicted transcriptional regulator
VFPLDPLDLNIILQFANHWWEPENHPFPAKGTLAQRIGVCSRTIQRRIAALESHGLVERVERRSPSGSKTNVYKLTGLIKEALPYAKEMLEAREKRKREKAARQQRMRPLRIVSRE